MAGVTQPPAPTRIGMQPHGPASRFHRDGDAAMMNPFRRFALQVLVGCAAAVLFGCVHAFTVGATPSTGHTAPTYGSPMLAWSEPL